MSRTVLVTGAAGFIGYHLSERLLGQGDRVVGLDNLNDYYDPKLKEARLAKLRRSPEFRFLKVDLGDRTGVEKIWQEVKPEVVVHLAAQAGEWWQKGFAGFARAEGCGEQQQPWPWEMDHRDKQE